MATAAEIKSAIASRGASQRGITRQLAGVTEQLQKAEEASRLAQMKEQEIGRGYGTLFSAFEVGATALEYIRQDQELKSLRQEFEKSLPESVRQAGGVTVQRSDRSSLIDVFRGKASMSDFLFGQEKYMLGERELGTKYDVAAMGERAKAMRQGDLLDQFFGGEPLPKSTISRELGMERPSIDVTKLYGKGVDKSTVEIPNIEEKPSMMDKVENGTLVESNGKIKMSAKEYLETDPPNAIREMIESSYPRTEEVPSAIARDVKDYENEKLAEFIPEIFEEKQEDALGPVTEERPVVENNFRERAAGYTFKTPKTRVMRTEIGGAKELKDKIKDLKTAQENLEGLRPEDKFNRKKFEKLVEERTSELQSLISEVYNPELDIFYGDDSTESITLRSELGSDSISFIKQLASK
jgi:hypothetical protein